MKNHKKLRNALATLLLALPLALQGAVGVKTAQAAETSTETATVTLHKYVFDKSLPSAGYSSAMPISPLRWIC